MKRLLPPLRLIVAASIVAFLSSLAAAQAYSVTNIGKASTRPSPRVVDNNGDVSGVFVVPTKPPQSHAFLYTKSGGIQDLGTLSESGNDSAAFGINTSGQVVGQANSSAGGSDQAFLWTKTKGMIDLGNLGGLEQRRKRHQCVWRSCRAVRSGERFYSRFPLEPEW